MIGKIKMMAIITFYVAVLLVIAVYLQDGSGTFSHFFENANLYIRNLRNVHAPAFHQTYDNYLQLFPLILLFGLKLVNPEKPDVPLNKNDAFQKVQKRRVQEKR